MSILSNSSNASARHKIDSKLRTMRMRITGNSVGRRGAEMASFYIFSKACYLHKDYIKLLEEIFPKPPAHSRRWCFSPFFSFPLRQQQNKLPLVIPSRCGRASSFSSFWRKEREKKKYKPVTFCTLFVHGNFFPACLRNDLFLLFSPRQHHYLELSTQKWCRRASKVSNEHNRHIHTEVPFTAIRVEMSVRGI